MKHFLIIPLGGKGQRFVDAGYKVYKPFLKINKDKSIIDDIVNNFENKHCEIILVGNTKRYQSNNLDTKKKIHIINIKKHTSGPLFSIFLAANKIKEIVGNNSLFIVYSDINWSWNFKEIKKNIFNKDIVIFTHQNFHPHLEVDSKSDFCSKKNKDQINDISQKKTISKTYQKDLLAIGCYYFSNFNIIENFFKTKNILPKAKKELYLTSLIKFLIQKKQKIFYKTIKNFVHLGFPAQYEDFLNWRNIILNNFNTSLELNYTNIMLMAGQGKRVKKLKELKPFLKIKNNKIYKFIFQKFGSKNNIIITQKRLAKKIKNRNLKFYIIKKTNSMFSTVKNSRQLFDKHKKFFLTSCDCFGEFDKKKFNKFLKKNKPDLVIFGYKFTNLQKHLTNSHTALELKKGKLVNINVKRNSKTSLIGHAGFFWVGNNKIFEKIENFSASVNLEREVIIDDYFKYLFDNNKFKISYYKLDSYVHIGSVLEYKEFKYWENYFLNENRKFN